MTSLLAIHIPDQILKTPWWVAGWVICCVWGFWACRNIEDEEIPQIGLFSAVFFLATLFHVPFMNVHLVLPGIMGIFLGKRVILAIVTAMLLQAGMGHGGFTTLGINAILPAGVASLSAWIVRPWLLHYASKPPALAILGFLLGFVPVCVLILLNAVVLVLGGVENFRIPALLSLVLHLPVAIAEGIFLTSALPYLAKAKIGPFRPAEITVPSLQTLALCLLLFCPWNHSLQANTTEIIPHNLRLDWKILSADELCVEVYYERGASFTQVELIVKDSSGKVLLRESNHEAGRFLVKIANTQTNLDLYVQADDHVVHAKVPAEAWTRNKDSGQNQHPISHTDHLPKPNPEEKWRDVFLGLSLILASTSFWMAWRALRLAKNR